MKFLPQLLVLAFIATHLSAARAQSFDPDPEGTAHRVLVVYNANWPDADGDGIGDSEQVARYYAASRKIPTSNLLGLACTTSYYYNGQTGWELFWDEIVVPMQDYIELTLGSRTAVNGIVMCYGMPYQINPPGWSRRALDTTLVGLWDLGDRTTPKYETYGRYNSYHDPAPTIHDDMERFDPLTYPTGGEASYLFGRLDGQDVEHALELVAYALYGDAYLSPLPGYWNGYAYADTRYGAYTWADLANYPYNHWAYANADKDMAYGRQWMEQAGFTLRWEPYGTEIGEPGALYEDGSSAETAPQAMFYEGWYNYNKYQPAFEWLVGSAACDLNSNSIARIRDENPGTFLGESFKVGLTCGVGCIAEPYLNGHPFPETFQYYLMLKGYTFGEAARISDPKLAWTNMYVGDILYQPMRLNKVALLDTVAPPPCMVKESAGAVAGERVFETGLTSITALPDVGELLLHYGATSAFGNTVTGDDKRPRLFHTATVSGLAADELIHYRADYTDPAGNTGLGTEFILHTALDNQPVLARATSSAVSYPAGTEFEIELIFGTQAGATELTAWTAKVTSAAMGWNALNIKPHLSSLAAEYFDSAGGELRSIRITVPNNLAVGSYLIEVSATSAAGSDFDSLTIDVY